MFLISHYIYADVKVNGYYKSNGTYVKPYYRSNPDGFKNNNWSTVGNTNPYTGKEGYLPKNLFENTIAGSRNTSGVINESVSCHKETGGICANEAISKINEVVKVCANIVEVHEFKKGYYLNLDRPYPNEPVSVVVWNDKISYLSKDKSFLSLSSIIGKNICITGKVSEYRGRTQITPNSSIVFYP